MAVSVDRLEGMAEVELRDLTTEDDAGHTGGMVMQPCPESGVDDLVTKIVRHVVVPHRVQVSSRSGGVEPVNIDVDSVCSEKCAEHLGHRRRDRAVRGGVFWVVGRGQDGRHPDCSAVAGLPSSYPGTGPKPSAVTAVGSSDPLIAVTGRQNK